MLDAEDLDAVIIANPNPLHVDTAIECLEAGVAVLLEKPVAVDYAQSLRLVDAVARLDGRLLVGHHRRHHPAIARARAAIRDGEIGQVVARQRTLVGAQGRRLLHRHALAPPAAAPA